MSEESDPKYLAVKNWEKYQPAYTSGQRARWIRSWVDKYDDLIYSRLSVFQRHILDGIRDMRGKLGKNPPADEQWLCNALALHRGERSHVGTTLQRLQDDGFLVLTNQQNDENFSRKRRGEERRVEENIKTLPTSRQKTPRTQTNKYTEKFSEFWKIYPLTNGSKAEAFKAWRKQPCCENGSYDLIIARVKEYTICPQWLDGFIPHAATWINQKRWESQPAMKARSNGSLTPLLVPKSPEKLLPLGPGQKHGGCDMGGMRWDNPGEYYKWQNENRGKSTV